MRSWCFRRCSSAPTWIIGRAANEAVLPNTLAFWRWLIAFAILLPIALPKLSAMPGPFVSIRELFLLGFLGMVVCGSLVYLSLHYTTATNATLIYTFSPVIIVLLEWGVSRHMPSARQAIGIALAFCGVAAVLMKGDLQRLLSFQFNPGDIGIAVAALAWASYSVLLKRSHFRPCRQSRCFASLQAPAVSCCCRSCSGNW
ncbi:MAG: DMT family transporter [Tepidamorphaceae bacterium]